MKIYYDKKRAEGKVYGLVLGVVCYQLLGRIYIVLKEQKAYKIR